MWHSGTAAQRHSTQHTAHSAQHTAHSTQRKPGQRKRGGWQGHRSPPLPPPPASPRPLSRTPRRATTAPSVRHHPPPPPTCASAPRAAPPSPAPGACVRLGDALSETKTRSSSRLTGEDYPWYVIPCNAILVFAHSLKYMVCLVTYACRGAPPPPGPPHPFGEPGLLGHMYK